MKPKREDIYPRVSVRLWREERRLLELMVERSDLSFSEVFRAGLRVLAERAPKLPIERDLTHQPSKRVGMSFMVNSWDEALIAQTLSRWEDTGGKKVGESALMRTVLALLAEEFPKMAAQARREILQARRAELKRELAVLEAELGEVDAILEGAGSQGP